MSYPCPNSYDTAESRITTKSSVAIDAGVPNSTQCSMLLSPYAQRQIEKCIYAKPSSFHVQMQC